MRSCHEASNCGGKDSASESPVMDALQYNARANSYRTCKDGIMGSSMGAIHVHAPLNWGLRVRKPIRLFVPTLLPLLFIFKKRNHIILM